MPLTPALLDELRNDLIELEAEIRASLEGTAEAARPVELDQPAIGRVSRIDAIQQQKMLEANRAAAQLRAQQVRSALRRVEDDAFGDCVGCGDEIPLARLKARPESAFCLECQSARERGR